MDQTKGYMRHKRLFRIFRKDRDKMRVFFLCFRHGLGEIHMFKDFSECSKPHARHCRIYRKVISGMQVSVRFLGRVSAKCMFLRIYRRGLGEVYFSPISQKCLVEVCCLRRQGTLRNRTKRLLPGTCQTANAAASRWRIF